MNRNKIWTPENTRLIDKSIFGTTNAPRTSEELIGPSIFLFLMWIALSYTLFQFYKGKKKNDEYSSRVVSLIHSIISISYSGYCVYLRFLQSGSNLSLFFRHFGCWNSLILADEQFDLLFSLTYFIIDIFGSFYRNPSDKIFILHHIGSIACCVYAVTTQIASSEIVLALFLLEGTNPLLHGRWLLIANKMENTNFYKFINNAFLFVFFIFRLILGSYMLYNFSYCSVSFLIKLFATGFLIFSAQYLKSIIGKIRRGEEWM